MADKEHLQIIKHGVEAWNRWRDENPKIDPDLKEADLHEVSLREVNLVDANLSDANLSDADLLVAKLAGADLSDANLRGANLGGANLFEAKLAGTDLTGVRLGGANLTRADLSDAFLHDADLGEADLGEANMAGVDLTWATLTKATLTGTRLSQAVVGYTTFARLDLSEARGLETVRHSAPSTIGVDTIYLSRGKIPQIFLRGAGVPDSFIEYMSSLVGTVFEYYSCFISYSSQDQQFADRIQADLQDNGVRCWFAPHHIQAGRKLHEQIDSAIRVHERLLLILSPNSITSEWVKTEIAKARRRELKEGNRVLFPIRLNISHEELQNWECFDGDTGKDSAREVREYYIPDFTGWKSHDTYHEEFKKLLRGFKKSEATGV